MYQDTVGLDPPLYARGEDAPRKACEMIVCGMSLFGIVLLFRALYQSRVTHTLYRISTCTYSTFVTMLDAYLSKTNTSFAKLKRRLPQLSRFKTASDDGQAPC
jgi:hypothetical protein